MEDVAGPRFDGLKTAIKKKRSQTTRRPRAETLPFSEGFDLSPFSSVLVSDDLSQVSCDENTTDVNSKGKMFNLNQCMPRGPPASTDEADYPYKKMKNQDRGSGVPYTNVLGDGTDNGPSVPGGNLRMTEDGTGNENKLKKVKLKVGSVTHTIHAKLSSSSTSCTEPLIKTARYSDTPQSRQKLILQDNSNGDHSLSDKKSGFLGIPWKDFSRGGCGLGKEDIGRIAVKNSCKKQGKKSDPVRKSKRVPKRRALDGGFDEVDEYNEIRYLEKLKTSKTAGYRDSEEESIKKQKSLSCVSKIKFRNMDEGGRSNKVGKKSRSDRGPDDTDSEEEGVPSDCEPEGKKKKQRMDPSDPPTETKREMTLTTRQRALLSSKDPTSASSANHIEFPNGPPPPPPQKQKEELTEVELQLKKAEAAKRRRMQNEKAARESEAEAIRKILGQYSSRKKREEKIKMRQEELAQEKAANAKMLASSTIRWVMGPSGTVVTFSQDMCLPKIFNSKPCSYPPPREKCAGPSCTNLYKYRDSKSKLPLCSLQCYKAIHAKMQMQMAF